MFGFIFLVGGLVCGGFIYGLVNEGMVSSWRISMPKTTEMSFIMAQAAKTMARPIRALVIWALALATAFSSPWDITHLRPPQMSMKKKTRATRSMIRLIPPETIFSICRSARSLKAEPVGV